jgi:molybdate transport system substrate-binding protein
VNTKRRTPEKVVRRWLCAAAWLCAVLVAAGCQSAPESPARRGRVRVAAASDLNAALTDVIARFGGSHDVDVAVSYGSSGNFYAQLLNEAPFDLFLSADVTYPNQLAARGLTMPQSEFTYAFGRLVLWAPQASPIDVEHGGLQSLKQGSIAHVAIANPEHAPYGRAAVAAMQAAGVYDAAQPKLVLGENVAQAMQFVQSGAADIGLVAMSLALAPAVKGKGRLFEVPPNSYPRIVQGGTILKWAADVDAARALRGFLLSADGQAILKQYGFSLPDR